MSVPVEFALPAAVSSIDVQLLVTLFDEVSDVAFFVKNVRGQFIAVNDSLLNRHGLKQKSDAIGKRPHEICPDEFGRVPSGQDDKVLQTREPPVKYLEMQ